MFPKINMIVKNITLDIIPQSKPFLEENFAEQNPPKKLPIIYTKTVIGCNTIDGILPIDNIAAIIEIRNAENSTPKPVPKMIFAGVLYL